MSARDRRGDRKTCRVWPILGVVVACLLVGCAARTPAPPAARSMPSVIHLEGMRGCARKSEAMQVSVLVRGGDLALVLQLLSQAARISIEAEGFDPSKVTVHCNLQNAPWDCVVREVARELGLTQRVEAGRIVIVR